MSWPAIACQLGMLVSTVGAILSRLGLGKPAALEAKPVVVRYERQRPGELIHIDSKKLGRIGGHRAPRHRPNARYGQSPSWHRLGSPACVHR